MFCSNYNFKVNAKLFIHCLKFFKELKKLIDNAEDKTLLIDEQENLESNLSKVETFKKEITQYELELENFRKEYYGQ